MPSPPASSPSASLLFASTWVRRYVCATAAYGFGRAATYDREQTKRYFNYRTGRTELKDKLFVEQFGRMVHCALAAPMAWPVMLGEDLVRLECAARGRDVAEYGVSREE